MENRNQYFKEYRNSELGRANSLLSAYNQSDRKMGRGKGDLTPQWIVENIFTKPCAHCGKTDWHKLGCNRINNDLPHTISNVEPCCEECNLDLVKPKKPLNQIDATTGEIIRTWESVNECNKNGFNKGHVGACCRGKEKTYKGYIWKYIN